MKQRLRETRGFGATYPGYFAAALRQAVDEKKRSRGRPEASDADVARWLGFSDKQLPSFNRWLKGHVHPRDEEDWLRLAELPGVTAEDLRHLEILDKLDVWRQKLDLGGEELAVAALEIAMAAGVPVTEVHELLRGLEGEPSEHEA